MSGFDEAREERNWLERLAAKIPGFKGFMNRELRRETDKMQREHLAEELGRLKGRGRELAREYTDVGKIGVLDGFERLDRRLDGLSQSIRFADYGLTGLFDAVKIDESDLEKLYEFDLSILDDLEAVGAGLSAIPSPGDGDPDEALAVVSQQLSELTDKWSRRETVINNAVEAR